MTCTVRRCVAVAVWRVRTEGHPAGDLDAPYCAEHAERPLPAAARVVHERLA